jgi:hypothetical protein
MSNVIDLFSKKDLEKMNNEIERKKNSVEVVIQIKNIYGQKDDISLDDKHDRIMESFFNLLEQLGKHSENSIGETVLLMNSEFGVFRGQFLEKDNETGLFLENVGDNLEIIEQSVFSDDRVKH